MADERKLFGDTNMLIIGGRVVRDAEYRAYDEEKGFCNFSIATNLKWGTAVNAFYLDCAIGGKRASKYARRLKRGVGVILIGALFIRQYEQNGQQRKATEMKVEKVLPVGKWEPVFDNADDLKSALKQEFDAVEVDDEDLPF
jgi:single-stranded DNA-binding protein